VVHSFTVGPLAENSYLYLKNQDALLIDPGFVSPFEFQSLFETLHHSSAKLKAILLTHAHVDHVAGLSKILEIWPDLPVFLSHRDLSVWSSLTLQSQLFGISLGASGVENEVSPLDYSKENLSLLPSFQFEVLYTPGHSPDHISIYFPEESFVFSGDVLFRQSVGRTDILKANLDDLVHSIREVLYKLPDETKVYPGHGPETTIGYEKQHNPFVRDSLRG